MNKKVMLAMSGGVDSSCALLLLQRQGYEVIGATMHLYDNEDIGVKSKTCCSLSDAEDARTVAARFNVPHYVFNLKDRFKRDVIENFNSQYIKGLTPNPCVDCNRYLKFDALMEKAKMLECDYIATGHYARIAFDTKSGRYLLKKAASADGGNEKDQSYVLYNLTQEQLKHTLFPLGETKKSEVRKIAQENGLINFDKPDSQDICFVPDGDYAKFIREYTGIIPQKGNVTDKSGNILGQHNGLINYTIGQRKGLGIAFGKPMYVVDKDAEKNTIIVGDGEDLLSDSLIAADLNWIAFDKVCEPVVCKAKTRYKQAEQPCTVYPNGENTVKAIFEQPQRAITKGQRIVFYREDIVIGGGVIV
ncbi:MAG: tRNA 2-thiouridine(34) synthase MnmA [Firmicutes bacterium]|nr:tRNA 2-thiouridine(34) synthase MnmA [[Eubacterium] siraeum]MCM1487869.1 tRNA 2-thiouridine(34) synthase MnmA [Bacillota bacterium]